VTFKPGAVVRVPFPFVDLGRAKFRPALALSSEAFNKSHGQAVMAMITSARHSRWPTDVPVTDLKAAGLPSPSVVRFKIFSLDLRLAGAPLGKLAAKDWRAAQAVLDSILPR
jgi:mRNA interferase MazF